MKTVCDLNMCTGCGACIEICPSMAISVLDLMKSMNVIIDQEKCIQCGACVIICQQIHPTELKEPIEWFQGWSGDPDSRRKSSSGAFAFSLAKQMVKEDGYVAGCKFEKGEFTYSITKSIDELELFRGSKYVKSNPEGIYCTVNELLKSGDKVLFIGLPCHVAGLKKFLKIDYENLITVDLICHGSPSPKLLDMFLNQYGTNLHEICDIHFRQKGNFRLKAENGRREVTKGGDISFTQPGVKDRYSLAFLNGLIYTENCYHCPYAGIKRISDITIGDSWGSELDDENKKRGISLALCQTEKGLSLLERSELELHQVNIENAVAANHQLREPFPLPQNRDKFFDEISNNVSFNGAVRKCFPKACFRLDLKDFLLRIGALKPRGLGEYRLSIKI